SRKEDQRDEREGDRVATQQIHPYNLGYGSAGRYSRTPARMLPRRRGARLPRGAAREPPAGGCGHDGDGLRSTQGGRPNRRAPPGKWTAAQIVHHLAISIDGSGRVFEDRRAKPPMRRRPRPLRQRLRQFVYLDVGWIPSGRRAPAATEPAQRPDPGAVERQL